MLPLLLTAAYHSGTDIPGLLDEARRRCPGCGSATARRWARTRACCARWTGGWPRPARTWPGRRHTAVVLAAAGSSHPAANAVIAQLAADWQATRGWQAVRPAYASAASPTPEQAVAGLIRDGARRVVVASYLLAPGRFADRVRTGRWPPGRRPCPPPSARPPRWLRCCWTGIRRRLAVAGWIPSARPRQAVSAR